MAPKAEKKPAKKVAKSTSSAAAKKRKLAKAETYKIYIYKVLKQVCCLTYEVGVGIVVVSLQLSFLRSDHMSCVWKTCAHGSHYTTAVLRCTQTPASAPRRCPS